MVLKNNKRGIFFTIMTIFLISLFILYQDFDYNSQERKASQSKIESINDFVLSIEKDLSRKIYVFAYRTLFLIEQDIFSTGEYSSNINESFQEAFLYGKFKNEKNEILEDSYLDEILKKTELEAEKFNLEIKIKNYELKVDQEDPWNVRVKWFIGIEIIDKNGLINISKNSTIFSFIPINDFEDPIYFINTGGLITNKFTKTPYSTLYNENGDITNLSNHIKNSYYLESENAPSFLDRLTGRIGPNENGIESFVNLEELAKQGLLLKEKSNIDYIYFSNENPLPLCKLNGLASFRIDKNNSKRYNITCN